MNAFDLVKLTKKEILENEEIKALYIKSYKAFFGVTPNCIKCSFNKDFNKFKRFLQGKTEKDLLTLKEKTMSSFKLKKGYSLKIFSYSKNKKVHRRYGKDLDDSFVSELIKFDKRNEQFFEELPKKQTKRKPKKKAESKEKEIETKDENLDEKEISK